MIGFKAFNKDLTCRGFQYDIGCTYKFDGEPITCGQGFHFCKTIAECYDYYIPSDDTRICLVDAIGDIATDDKKKYCTNKITIVKEITEEWKRKGNNGATNTGYCNKGNRNIGNRNTGDRNTGNRNTGNRNTGDWNTGYWNTGDRNTGYWNTGDWNTGDRNTGNCNTGNRNTGNRNTGDRNTGDWNTGYWNTGYWNTGDWNTGDRNTGNCNTGNRNTGNRNTGNRNTGNRNTGDWNTGDCNTGNRNTGDWNKGNHNTGMFNTKTQSLMFFDEPSDWTYDQWMRSDARKILKRSKEDIVEWISEEDMTDKEKEQNPQYKTAGGYVKVLDKKESAQVWWDGLPEWQKKTLRDLPNYDEGKLAEILGIKLEREKND